MTFSAAGLNPVDKSSSTMGLVVGLGARDCTTEAEIQSLISACLAEIGEDWDSIRACVTHGNRSSHPALAAIAQRLGVPLRAVDVSLTSHMAPSPSVLVDRHRGVPSVAEAAALAFGPLLLGKRKSANATCALAAYCPQAVMASTAASTLATSRAGP